jgi:hypothetical protein
MCSFRAGAGGSLAGFLPSLFDVTARPVSAVAAECLRRCPQASGVTIL